MKYVSLRLNLAAPLIFNIPFTFSPLGDKFGSEYPCKVILLIKLTAGTCEEGQLKGSDRPLTRRLH